MIQRDVQAAARDRYDVIVVGGGVYGACVALEAARRGLRVLLLERDDFGSRTSWNSLRILHGGLRYLQTLDLPRFRESVRERRWFCQHFPDLVRPLACLMPLYGRGVKRPAVFRVALRLNDWLSARRNGGVDPAVHLPASQILNVGETVARFPAVCESGLRGAALWHDAVMVNSQRVVMELLRWACALGAGALNYVSAQELVLEGKRAAGVRALDVLAEQEVTFHAKAVINCAGPWSRSLAQRFDRDVERLFRPSLAFNVLLDHSPLSEAALAVQAPQPGAQVMFMHPWFGRILAGTAHVPWDGGVDEPMPSAAQLDAFVEALNAAVPGLNVGRSSILRVYAGLLPAAEAGSAKLACREMIHRHGDHGGPENVLSVSGVKFTTARDVAEKALRRAWRAYGGLPPYRAGSARPIGGYSIDLHDPHALASVAEDALAAELRRLVDEEAVMYLEDLLLRRTNWGAAPRGSDGAWLERICRVLRVKPPAHLDVAHGASIRLPPRSSAGKVESDQASGASFSSFRS